jgi:hypothetical protein
MAKANKLRRPKFNLYEIRNNIEHELFETVSAEFCDVAGFEVEYYVLRNDVYLENGKVDDIYGEPKFQNITYDEVKKTKVIYQPTEEPTFTGMFGINSEEILQFASIPKLNFTRDVGTTYPKPGDVIYTLWNDRAYEVVHVEEEEGMFLAAKFSWNFILRPFRYSDQTTEGEVDGTAPDEISTFKFAPATPWRRNYVDDGRQTTTSPLSAFGDNKAIEEESDGIYDYTEIDSDTNVYGY